MQSEIYLCDILNVDKTVKILFVCLTTVVLVIFNRRLVNNEQTSKLTNYIYRTYRKIIVYHRLLRQNKAGCRIFGPLCRGWGQSAVTTRKPTKARLADWGGLHGVTAGPGSRVRPHHLSVGAKYVLGPAIHAASLMTSRRHAAVAVGPASSLLLYSAELSPTPPLGDATTAAAAAAITAAAAVVAISAFDAFVVTVVVARFY